MSYTFLAVLGPSLVVQDGIGPMFLSPISEIPRIGRNPPYLFSFIVFFAISLAIAWVDNFPGLIVLRFLQGLFGSPRLASGGASIEDVYDMYGAAYGYIWWMAAMYCGPYILALSDSVFVHRSVHLMTCRALSPLLDGYAVQDNWRWPLYEIVIMAAIVLVMLPFSPESSPSTILLGRAKRLRMATGNASYLAPSELNPVSFGPPLKESLNRPGEMTFKDPAVAYMCLYGGIVYATYYSFFGAFPLVYLQGYGMSLGGLGLIFTSIILGCIVGLLGYWWYLRNHFIPSAKAYHKEKGVPVPQEQWLKPGLVAVWGPPAGLFLFAWTARPDIHWIVPTTGIAIFSGSSFWVFQCLICYIPLTYPKYAASLFAANDFTRSMLAATFVQFSRQMYLDLGIDRGVTLVAGLSMIGIFRHFGLYQFGRRLRASSKSTS